MFTNPESKEIPLPGATITSTPASISKLALTDKYPEESVGLTRIGLSTRYQTVSTLMSDVTGVPCPSNGIVLYQTPLHPFP